MEYTLNNEIDFEEMRCCRACLSVASQDELADYIDLLQLYSSESDTLTLLELFNKSTQLYIGVEDFHIVGYPPCHYICGRCRLDLVQAYEFITRAQLNHQLLTQSKQEIIKGNEYAEDHDADELEKAEVEEEFIEKDFEPVEYERNSNSTGSVLNDDNNGSYEPLPTTLISVERVFSNEPIISKSNINASEESPDDEEAKSSSCLKLSQRGAEERNTGDESKSCFDFKCEFCTSVFQFQRDLLQHYEVEHGDKTHNFPCEYCPNRFVSKNVLRLHRRQVHQKDEYIDCEHCGRTVLKTFYNKHLKRHKQLKFLCNKCPKICASRFTLKRHLELHSDERDRNIECIDCGKRFFTLENLQLHQTTHILPEDRAIFECTICSKTFLRKSNLGLHMQMHRGKTIDCPHCGKKFVRRKDLEVHIRFHTGDFPFACSMCDRKFAIKGHLNYHEKRHLGVRYKCDECEKTFINLAGLRQHQYEHTGMPLLCGVCQRGFPTKFKVRRHLRTVHQDLFKKTGYTDALAKKYILSGSKSTVGEKKETEFADSTEGTVEMLEEHAGDIPLNMLDV
ncbi:PREDICTED: zinc finger protein 227-like [Rhagoletis zephyria]|uniref:zinc finger protein 227-like n=2 Tax=Rhagoletis zephyria TaxID=28612 RepID=UPI000811830B|nr:PREDICTED: zinc finger protein 227-like [Rhagoletis zephyria]